MDRAVTVHDPNAIVVHISNVQATGRIDANSRWIVQLRRQSTPPVAGVSSLSISGYHIDSFRQSIDAPDALVLRSSDVQVTVHISRKSLLILEQRVDRNLHIHDTAL